MRVRALRLGAGFLLVAGALVFTGSAAADQPTPQVRGPHVSGFVHKYVTKHGAGVAAGTSSSCSTPGSGNYRTDCHSVGSPVNETWITTDGSGTFYAGANDYNSYNGQGQDGFYWSSDGVNWNDAGPIDAFPHDTNNASGDPGLAVGGDGAVYYSSLLFNYKSCSVGGVELLRRDPNTGSWGLTQIAADSNGAFQDKPAISADSTHVFESWTQFGSCSGTGVTSPIKVAVFSTSPFTGGSTTLTVPGSTYSQGSSIAADGNGGFWITWEEYPSSSSATGGIKLAHWDGTSWNTPQTISPAGFTDLPSPLPGFLFRDNSFPALTLVAGKPQVVWASYDTGAGRTSLWSATTVSNGFVATGSSSIVADSGGNQFFPAVAPDGSGGVFVSYSQVTSNTGYDQFLVDVPSGGPAGAATKVSTATSNPGQDAFFGGKFIGDYNGLTAVGGTAHPIWTDIRGPGPLGYEMDAMVSSPAASAPAAISSLSLNPSSVIGGNSSTGTVTLTAPAPGGGAAVSLTSSNGHATLPSSVTVPAGQSSATFTINTTSVPNPVVSTITAAYLGVQKPQNLTITPTPVTPDFTISAAPSSQTVTRGRAASYTVTITRPNGFTGSVALSVIGKPSRSSTSFSSNPIVNPNLTSTLTVQTGSRTGRGTFTLTLTGTSGSLSHNYTVTLIVQ